MVFAFDDAGDQASASVHYWIIDIDDHYPHFQHQHYNVTVGEATDVNQQIFSVTAQDEDVEANAEIIYEIANGNEDGMFKLKDAYHCNLLVAKALDFESRSSYVLNITASNYQSGYSNWTVLSISVIDEDDLPARFDTFEDSAYVREDATVGTYVLQVTATDQDKLNASVTYEIVESTNKRGLFVINASSGVISLNGTLDREAEQEYMLRVLARSTFHLPDHVTVVIQIGDVNDNPPVFTDQSYSFVIGENAGFGAIVGQVKATDADKGNNATFSYFLKGGEDHFIVDPHTGVITVNSSLDREKQENYSIVVIAKETQTLEKYSSNVTVVVNVEDRNDNAPRFVEPFYDVTLKEELPSGTPVIQVFANDSDTSSNAVVTYSFVPDVNDHYLAFDVNNKNGSIKTTKKLDREGISEYSLTVKAENSASQEQERLSSTVSVKVTLEDINDNVPTFDKQSYTVTISEATQVNTTILTVKAMDRDVGKNSEIRFTLDDGNVGNVFSIDHSSGAIGVAEDLDRENVEDYNLVITAKDGGNKSTTVNVTVHVSDVNDNSPQFTSPGGYQFSVMEETAGLTVGSVKATDSDKGENAEIVYLLMSTSTSERFRINSSTGEISTAEALDRETFGSHLLIVQADDKGVPQSRRTAVQVSINVTDVNDNVPRFFEDQPELNTVESNLLCGAYTTTEYIVFRVEDFTPANTEVGRVKSFDKDDDLNANIFYRIQGNDSSVFSIASQTGIIRTNRHLKRDEKAAYNLTVIAENSVASPKLSSNVTVHVIVYDVSDQRPQFSQSAYKAEVAESVTSGTSVMKINVTNSEQATSKFVFKILYDQSSAGSRKFVIEPETGIIITQGQLDRETTTNYTLKVQAKVLNTVLPEALSSIVPVFINITDVDDNSPLFIQRSYRFTSSELSRVGDVIGQVRAVDIDSDKQSKVFYAIAGGNEKGLFNISEDLGVIHVVRTLEHDANSTFHLVIQARDSPVSLVSRKRRGEGAVFDEVSATIEVQDENNNAPIFIQNLFIGVFYENEATKNKVVASVQAFDNDFGVYGSLQYSIVHEQDPGIFSLSPLTGEVTLSTPSALVSGKLEYALAISAADNLGIAPYNRAKQNASVRIFVLSDSNQLSIEMGVHPELAKEKISEINSMLRNVTGATVIIKDIQETGDGKSIIYFHAIEDNSLHVLDQEDFMSRLQNNSDFINGIFSKWNIHTPTSGSAEMSTGAREELSAVIAAMLVLSVGIGVAGIIGIIIACRKRRRVNTIYKTSDTRESSFPHPTAWYSMDIPGIEAFIDSKAQGTPRSVRGQSKYTVQKEQAAGRSSHSLLRTPLRSSKTYKMNTDQKKDIEMQQTVALNHFGSAPSPRPDHKDSNEPSDQSPSLIRTPLRSSKTYKVKKDLKKEVERQQIVALNRYGLAPNPSSGHKKSKEAYESVDSVPGNAMTGIENFESHDNAGFEHSKEQDKIEKKTRKEQREEISETVDEKPDKKDEEEDDQEGSIKDRKVRFDLRGVKEKKKRKQRRLPMGHIPDIIVNSRLNKTEEGRPVADDSDDDENLPADITSVFQNPMRIGMESGNLAQIPASAYVSAVSDEEGTVVEI